jgi:hypothetical protein
MMQGPVPTDPFFSLRRAEIFQRKDIADLAGGLCVAIHVRGAIASDTCAEILGTLSSVEFEPYGKERVQPAVLRYGVAVSDHNDSGRLAQSYWQAMETSERGWRALGLSYDPFEMCRNALGHDWPQGVEVARHKGRLLSPGVAREPNDGFLIHFDDAAREFTDPLLDEYTVAQFAFNLYLSVPEEGGETIFWRHTWDPRDESHRRPGSYGFSEEVVAGLERLEVKPQVGDALLLNPRYFHAVSPSQGGRRIALGFRLGMTDSGRLTAWG